MQGELGYETAYRIDTADAQHRQYHPDFYLPQIDAYLEHWAVDQNGEPPPEFKGYKDGMAWKRKLHAENGTTLLETTMAERRQRPIKVGWIQKKLHPGLPGCSIFHLS